MAPAQKTLGLKVGKKINLGGSQQRRARGEYLQPAERRRLHAVQLQRRERAVQPELPRHAQPAAGARAAGDDGLPVLKPVEIKRSAALQGCLAAVGRPEGLPYARSPSEYDILLIGCHSLLLSPSPSRLRSCRDAASLDTELRAVAALAGEPRIVSAAGVTRDETPILTIENPDAFDAASPKRRLVLVGGADGRSAEQIIALVRLVQDTRAAGAAPAVERQRAAGGELRDRPTRSRSRGGSRSRRPTCWSPSDSISCRRRWLLSSLGEGEAIPALQKLMQATQSQSPLHQLDRRPGEAAAARYRPHPRAAISRDAGDQLHPGARLGRCPEAGRYPRATSRCAPGCAAR